jgi:hypothetical protein
MVIVEYGKTPADVEKALIVELAVEIDVLNAIAAALSYRGTASVVPKPKIHLGYGLIVLKPHWRDWIPHAATTLFQLVLVAPVGYE